MTPEQIPTHILEQAHICVKCGLCLPHCPTYRKNAQEGDSPRGRIALVQGLLSGAVPDSPVLGEHLDRCLECHACEAVCPSAVPVTRIIDGVRAIRMDRRPGPRRWLRRWLLDLAVRPAASIPWVRLYQRMAPRAWLQRSGLLRRLGVESAEGLLPKRPLTGASAGHFPAFGPVLGHVALFPGCLGRYLDAPALAAATAVLTRLGYAVTLPRQPCCCGALHRHDGFARRAEEELRHSAALLAGYDRALTLASACLESLRQAPDLAGRALDATRFVADLAWPPDLDLAATSQRVWVHIPCSQGYAGDADAAMALLRRIPGVIPMALLDNETCCGAAGTYMLRQPRLSEALLADKLRLIQAAGATLVVTTNTGCALRLAAGLRARDPDVRVCHPLEVLAARLKPLHWAKLA